MELAAFEDMLRMDLREDMLEALCLGTEEAQERNEKDHLCTLYRRQLFGW